MPTKALCNSEEESDLRRGPWTIEEDNLLINYISQHGEGRWNLSARCAGLKRTGKSCRLRWLNYLKPDVKRGNLTPQEQLSILELHSKLGNRWSKIAQHLPGRTDNEIKNYWRTRVQKQARQLRIDSDSESFLHAIRCFWTPNMLQNVEQVGPSHHPTFPFSSTLDSTILPPSISNHTPPFNTAQRIDHAEDNSGVLSSHQLESSQFHQISEHPASPCAYGNIFYNHPSLNGNLPMLDNSSYDMEDYDPAAMSAIGNGVFFPSDCHMEEGDWASGEMEDTTWNMGELWQFGGVE